MNQRYKCKTTNSKTSRRNHQRKYLWAWVRQKFAIYIHTPKAWWGIKEKNDKYDFIKINNVSSSSSTGKRMKTHTGKKYWQITCMVKTCIEDIWEILKKKQIGEKSQPNEK